jgi:hypothetical protein
MRYLARAFSSCAYRMKCPTRRSITPQTRQLHTRSPGIETEILNNWEKAIFPDDAGLFLACAGFPA